MRNSLAELERAMREAADSLRGAGASVELIRTVHLALEEVITNILKYGYDDRAEHIIEISLSSNPSELLLEITDDGHAFNPLAHPAPNTKKSAEQREPGGLGIEFLRKLFDQLDYQRAAERNLLSLRKQLQPV
jgi:serine/threonine-protein kinase RsbW